jgi:hypothetical protein
MADKTSTWRTGRHPETGMLSRAMSLASVRRPELRQRGNLFYVALVLQLGGVGLLAWIGWVHWVLWHVEGYHFIPTDGPFFLVDAIAGIVLALVLLVWPRPIVGLASAGFTASTILALVISLTVGLFGFNENIHANYVVLALVVESITVVVLLAWTVLAAWALPRGPNSVR